VDLPIFVSLLVFSTLPSKINTFDARFKRTYHIQTSNNDLISSIIDSTYHTFLTLVLSSDDPHLQSIMESWR
jgi:hypothetical protein